MKKFMSICFVGCMLSNSVLADDSCGDFHIQISNLTGETCVLTSQKVSHGNLSTPPPISIPSGDSKRFDMSQTEFYGPEIRLSYQCGSENISFVSQQNYCAMEAGNITGILLSPLPENINAYHAVLPGSYWWSKSGSINWEIVKLEEAK
jgi:hypothetical protein